MPNLKPGPIGAVALLAALCLTFYGLVHITQHRWAPTVTMEVAELPPVSAGTKVTVLNASTWQVSIQGKAEEVDYPRTFVLDPGESQIFSSSVDLPNWSLSIQALKQGKLVRWNRNAPYGDVTFHDWQFDKIYREQEISRTLPERIVYAENLTKSWVITVQLFKNQREEIPLTDPVVLWKGVTSVSFKLDQLADELEKEGWKVKLAFVNGERSFTSWHVGFGTIFTYTGDDAIEANYPQKRR